jgi:hypothetical protein
MRRNRAAVFVPATLVVPAALIVLVALRYFTQELAVGRVIIFWHPYTQPQRTEEMKKAATEFEQANALAAHRILGYVTRFPHITFLYRSEVDRS